MRFPKAWANIAKENVSLKVSSYCMAIVLVLMTVSYLKLSLRKPVIIERACATQALIEKGQEEPTAREVKDFLHLALVQRFTTGANVEKSFFSQIELKVKKQEEEIFEGKKIKQLIIVRNVLITKERITAHVDRVFSMGKARPAYPSILVLDVQEVRRSLKNPYGLIVNEIKPLKTDEKKEGGKE